MKPKPLLRGHFHQAMFFICLGACVPLLFRCDTTLELIGISIYSLGLLTLFGVSTLYHRVTWTPSERSLWKKFDHSAIYIMIAGTMTPLALLKLSSDSAQMILIIIWSIAFIGVIQSIFFVNLPKMVSALFYIIAGYTILPYLGELQHNIGTTNVAFILAGGVAYSLGALAYGLKRPVFNPKVFSYHEVFHLFVNLGALFHFIVIHSIID